MSVLNAIDPTASVHPTARVWHFSVVLQHAVLGEAVNIGSHCEIGRGTTIAARTRIGSGTFLPPHSVVGEDVFIGPHCMFCDDKTPFIRRPEDGPYLAEPPIIEDGAVIGAGCVVLPGVRIGKGARIGAGAVVTRDVLEGSHVRGEPARVQTLTTSTSQDWK